jgi:hypothetical protein
MNDYEFMQRHYARRRGLAIVAAVVVMLLLVVLAGCGQGPMTPQEMRNSVDECEALGLRAVYIHTPLDGQHITCRPHRDDCLHD